MNKKIAIIKRSAYVLGILLLLLGLLPIPFVSRVGSAFAQEEEPTPIVLEEEPAPSETEEAPTAPAEEPAEEVKEITPEVVQEVI